MGCFLLAATEEQKVITKEKHGQPMVIHWNKMLDEQKAVAKGKNRQEVTNHCNIIPDREKQPIGHLFLVSHIHLRNGYAQEQRPRTLCTAPAVQAASAEFWAVHG